MSIDYEEVKGKIRGPAALLMAPFKDNYDLDIEALKENIRFIMDGGITNGKGHIICPCGGGEMVALSREEHKMMVEAAVGVAGNKLVVVAGVGSCDYREAIELANNAAEAGAKCVMLPPPYYHHLTQEDIYRWYKVIAEEIKIGIMAYPQPWREYVGGFISVPLLGQLAEIENMVAAKYTPMGMRNYITALSRYSKRFAFIDNCNDCTVVVTHMHGAAGYISLGGCWPEFEAKFWSLLEQCKYEEAVKWRAKVSPLFEFSASEGPFPEASVGKAVLEYQGLYGGPLRPPFLGLTKEQKNKLFGVLEGMGVPKKR